MTMTREQIAAFVDALYGATAVADWEKAADMLTEDFVAVEADCLPMAGEYRGKNGLRDLYGKVMAMVDVAGLERTDLLIGTDSAIALLSIRFADPSLAPAQVAELFRFRDGKCCEIKPYYFDPEAFNAAARAKAG